ncbi:hypothetical protein HGM15179_012316 [Zosterops borbonicus]|uniref:Uncharacterized protein n=1 Tax=Zosterops borbonicus TaxID=364589 RepID=A0A8K1LI75_9PASS|nr:hypothetical protein HGM15179_012316 [Zosterops borbonicus]
MAQVEMTLLDQALGIGMEWSLLSLLALPKYPQSPGMDGAVGVLDDVRVLDDVSVLDEAVGVLDGAGEAGKVIVSSLKCLQPHKHHQDLQGFLSCTCSEENCVPQQELWDTAQGNKECLKEDFCTKLHINSTRFRSDGKGQWVDIAEATQTPA